jgi:ATP/maltotriose-dependent transcriptional regulator MalT
VEARSVRPPVVRGSALVRGREAFARRAWTETYEALSEADGLAPLAVEDLERVAVAAYLLGREAESTELLARAHHDSLAVGDTVRAARSAFWLAFGLLFRGEPVRAGGWLAHAHSLLEGGPDCVEQGYLLIPKVIETVVQDPAGAYDLAEQAQRIGDRFGDPDLVALGRLGRGESLLRLGDADEGASLLDEAMVAVEAGEVSPIVAGVLYCAVIEVCRETFDLRRAQQWTAALTDWCAEQPDLVPYRGQCLVHRSEIMQLSGEWAGAMEELDRAQARLSDPPGQTAIGTAHYQRGELHRLQAESSAAEKAYRRASECGRAPEPGLALLRLEQGKVAASEAMIRRALGEAVGDIARARLLGAFVEIMIAAGHVDEARGASDEFSELAARRGAPALDAAAAYARGTVLFAGGEPHQALQALRRAWVAWNEIGAPYEAARVRVSIGLACRELSDLDSARMEWEAARRVFDEVGARPDLARLDALMDPSPPLPGGLTPREIEVLRLVAAGKTNRQIAAVLVISERTVDRHMSNILTKLGSSNRAGVTAYAYEHGLV